MLAPPPIVREAGSTRLDIAEGHNVDVCINPYVWHEVPSDAFDVVISVKHRTRSVLLNLASWSHYPAACVLHRSIWRS